MRRPLGRARLSGRAPVLVAIAGIVGLLCLVVVIAPPLFVRDSSLEGLKAQNEVRTTLLQGLGVSVLLMGAVFAYGQLHTAQEGQITERYTRAIDQLGHDSLDVRLGGIYALERIARDSPADRTMIGEVLTAFVRTHAPWPPSLPGQPGADADYVQMPALQVRAPDVQASLTVLGRGGFAPPRNSDGDLPADIRNCGSDRLDLAAVDLRGANLSGANLECANLASTHLEHADLSSANLERADLTSAHLHVAKLRGTNLKHGQLFNVRLVLATVGDADLEGAWLIEADLRHALFGAVNLQGALLLGARLEGASLEQATLDGVQLSGAKTDDTTTWPPGFDPGAAGLDPA